MLEFENPLDNVRVASPCSADWSRMSGDDRKRFCGDCKLTVYNLSGMTRYDAENLLRLSEGRLCVRYYRRSDGTIMTSDCPVGWSKVKQRVRLIATTALSLVLSLFSSVVVVSYFSRKHFSNREVVGRIPVSRPTPVTREEPGPLMGTIAIPPARHIR